jgi:DnaJ-class molecular chaperone
MKGIGTLRGDDEITITDVSAFIRKNVSCPLCKGAGKAMLTDQEDNNLWVAPRPCPICQGVGQVHSKRLPMSQEFISDAMINYKFK